MTHVRLAEVLTLRTKTESFNDPAGERFVTVRMRGLGAIQRAIGEGKTPRPFRGTRVIAGDLIYSRIDARNGAFAIIGDDLNGAVVSKDFPSFEIDSSRLDPSYIGHLVRAPSFWSAFQTLSFGATNRQRIDERLLLAQRIPLPPLPEQRRIAAILDEADALRFKMMASDRLLENLESSTFDALVRRVNRRRVRLSDVARTTSGGTPSRAQTGNYAGPIPWVKSGEVGQGLVMSTSETITEMALKRSSAKVMPIGTVLVAMYGATAGEVGVLGIEAATNQAVCAITPGLGLDSGFLRRALLGMKPHLKSKAVGGAQPNLSQGMIRDIELDLPSLEQQHEIAQKCDEISRLRSHRAECALNDALFASLQHRAFRGEL